ncbi:MAG: hypothetical protein GY940_16615, partial [bacterium]|nr:hypothetical protein [bacterium]
SFNTLQERKEALSGKLSLYLEGVLRAIMEIKKIDADEAKKIMEGFEAQGMSTREFYGILQEWLGDKILVEKTPQYTFDIEILKRAEDYFDSPLFIHLIRNPYAVISSFENARLDQLFKYDHQFSSRELGELLWVISHQNILEFLERIPDHRRYPIKYEELVNDPGHVVSRMCNHFGLEYYDNMLQIYDDSRNRMTDGIHAESKMLGDVKFFTHSSIDTKSVDNWKEKYKTEFLGDAAVKLTKLFGYLSESAGDPGIEPTAPKEYHELSPHPLEKREYYDVSFGQKRVWLLSQSEESSLSFNMSGTYPFNEELNRAVLNKVADSLIQRHEGLRTVFLA